MNLEQQEREEMVRDAIVRCRQIIEDGWEDENHRYIESGVAKILYSLQEKTGIPSGQDIEKTMRAIKEKYGPGQMHLESAIGYLMHMEKEWLGKLGSPQGTPEHKKNWDDVFGVQ